LVLLGLDKGLDKLKKYVILKSKKKLKGGGA